MKRHTSSVRTFTKGNKVYNAVFHLQHCGALAVEYRDTVRAPRLVCRQTAREDHEAFTGIIKKN